MSCINAMASNLRLLTLRLCCCIGGSPYAVVGILDTMRAIQPEISTIAMGTVMSTATVLLVGCADVSPDLKAVSAL